MNLSKRGQVTLFIVLGIVILGVISFVFFIYSSAQKSVSTKDTEEIAKELQRYVDELIRDKTIEAFKLLSSQGFKIYHGVAQGCNVQITNVQQSGNSEYCPYTELLSPQENSLIPVLIDSSLDDYQEESHLHFLNLNNVYGTVRVLPQIEDVSNQEAITNQINSYIGNKLRSELNTALTSFFSQKGGYSFRVVEEPRISTKIEDRITVNVDYDISIEKAQKKNSITKSIIQIDYNFPKIYNFVKDLINSDVRRLDYDITSGSQDFEARKRHQTNYDIIEVRDLRNQFEGEDYIVKFARRNRAPDANSISIQGKERDNSERTLGRDEGVIFDGGTLTLRCNPNADPDEETNLRYEISGKGTFVNKGTFNPSGCFAESDVLMSYATNPQGNRIKSEIRCGSTVNTLAEDVGNELGINIIDSNNLRDKITYSSPVKCDTNNNHCNESGQWRFNEQTDCISYHLAESCGPCPPPAPICTGPPNQQTCTTPPQPPPCCDCTSREYKSVVDEKGECIKTNQPA